jgi:putative redox protein
MKSRKISFKNSSSEKLSAHIELPPDQHPHDFALFAHCFTCNKNLKAVGNISRALTNGGFGVMRFDFTGLGESEGDFSETNFSSNIQDLISAAQFLEDNYRSPVLIIGHSLGGAAAIYAGAQIKSVRAIATIGAPSNPKHVEHLFQDDKVKIQKQGFARVSIGGREFTIQKQFIDDLENTDMPSLLDNLRKAILILHSPQDQVVDIKNAAEIYTAAHHPKSYLSLDGADHLLSASEDSLYAGDMISHWARRYTKLAEEHFKEPQLQVLTSIGEERYTTQITTGKHRLMADEPEDAGGNDFGPTPYELVLAGLGSCTAITLRMYADRKNWDLKEVDVHLAYEKIHATDCDSCENSSDSKLDRFTRVIELHGDLDKNQQKRLLEIAEKCPVHRTLTSEISIMTSLKEDPGQENNME